jgi:protein-L-isoaspartate(D-aspartate) O-methyltransferase
VLHQFNEFKYRNRRKFLIKELREKGIRSEQVLKAIEDVPRHLFIDSALSDRAYEDSALPIDMGQTISQPYTVARQTELLDVLPGEKVLEIGTGSGYQCAILCAMGAKVYTIERHKLLYERAREIIGQTEYRAMFKHGDGTQGWTAYAPYDAIVVTAGAPVIPEALREQLADGGRLVIPVGDEHKQAMYRIIRQGDDFYEETYNDFKFVPLIGKDGWKSDY